LLSTVW